MTEAEVQKTARDCIAEIRDRHPGRRFTFVVAESLGCLAVVIEGERQGPTFPKITDSAMWAVQLACNELIGLNASDNDEILRSAGMGVAGRPSFH